MCSCFITQAFEERIPKNVIPLPYFQNKKKGKHIFKTFFFLFLSKNAVVVIILQCILILKVDLNIIKLTLYKYFLYSEERIINSHLIVTIKTQKGMNFIQTIKNIFFKKSRKNRKLKCRIWELSFSRWG